MRQLVYTMFITNNCGSKKSKNIKKSQNIINIRLDIFGDTVLKVLSKTSPIKKRYVRANEAPFKNKVLKNAIMKRSQLRNVFLKKKKTLESQVAYNKQRNYFTSLLRKEKQSYFENIDTSKISENKIFWKTMKPMFSNKSVNRERITLVKGHKILKSPKDILIFFLEYIIRRRTSDSSGSYRGSSSKNYREIQKNTIVWLLYWKTKRIVPSVLGTYPLMKLLKK